MKTKTWNAQILLVTLLVLMIIIIIVVGVVALANRDVVQTVSNQKYSELYNSAETTVLKLVDRYGKGSIPLSNLTAAANVPSGYACTADTVPGQYKCSRSETNVVNQLTVVDSKDVIDYELGKDKSFTVNLSGYRGEIQMNWTGNVAIEFGLIYQESGVYKLIGDLYDTNNPLIFESNGGDPLTDPSNNHAIAFATNPGVGGIRFTVGSTAGLPAGATTISLRVTARMTGTAGSTLLTLRGTGAGYPNQVRVFNSSSYSVQTGTNVLAQVVTQIPLYPQVASVLYYALLTNGIVQK